MSSESNNQEQWDIFHEGSEENSQIIPKIEISNEEDELKIVKTEDTIKPVANEPYETFVYKLFKESSKVCEPPSALKEKKMEKSFKWEANITKQNRNTIKFMMRIFLKYHHEFSSNSEDQERIEDVTSFYIRLYNCRQGKINLGMYKYIFNLTKHSERNRQIFHQILSNFAIMNKELFENGNVKKKSEYFFACKIMKIRCRSKILCERTECE